MAQVVLVDDDHVFNRSVETYLTQTGVIVNVAENAIDGRRLIRSTDPDVIFIDVNMPLESGLTMCTRLRQEGVKIPIVIVTADDSPATTKAALKAGADTILIKPFAMKQLSGIIDDSVRRGSKEES